MPYGYRQELVDCPSVVAEELLVLQPDTTAGKVLRSETVEDIWRELRDCHRCSLGDTRTNLVFGVGNEQAEIVFVGEAPGRDEDLNGEPFVGEAGQLLTKIILAMGFAREDVYICNVLKCRPPNNRNPLPKEIEACEPFLLRQLQAISPKVIVALGTFAAQTLLHTRAPISQLRGRIHDYHGIPLMPTFHPAFLLRSPAKKREVWDDMKEVLKMLGREPTAPEKADEKS
ncbi:MAG: uracil-DNA glycosylase [Deltaproteobacteria bacterium]|nr:uracil-DNA glycosylase [Deltaproteobacteria bacterium]